MTLSALHESIALVCPIHGVSSDGAVDFSSSATEEQRSLAGVIASEWDFATGAWRQGSVQAAQSIARALAVNREHAVQLLDSTEPVALAVKVMAKLIMDELQAMKTGKPKSSKTWNEHKAAAAEAIRAGLGDS